MSFRDSITSRILKKIKILTVGSLEVQVVQIQPCILFYKGGIKNNVKEVLKLFIILNNKTFDLEHATYMSAKPNVCVVLAAAFLRILVKFL